MILASRKNCFAVIAVISFFFLILSTRAFSQTNAEPQEIPILQMSINDIKDIPVENFRNFIITTPNVVEIQNLPNNILRVKASGPGTTLVYIWDAHGRKTIRFDVSNFAASQMTNYRPGFNPQGTEFSYHTALTNQVANGQLISPFWNHDFTASVPIHQKNEWRTLLSATTNASGINNDISYAPFSGASYPNQMLSYYRTPKFTVAAGDVNYNPGELSITSFPLRGGSVEVYKNGTQDELEIFGGLSRPRVRSDYIFNDPKDYLYGFSGAKEIWPNIVLKSSFVYLDQPTFATVPTGIIDPTQLFPQAAFGQSFKNDFVADIGVEAHPISDEFTMEGEFGKSSDDYALRGLAEYSPFWGRLMLSYKQLGENYVQPANFFLQKNYRETNFITDYHVTRKLGLSFNYQLSQFGADKILLTSKTTVNRFSLSSQYQLDELTSYVSTGTFAKSESTIAPQDSERIDFTYQHNFKEKDEQIYTQVFQQYFKNGYFNQSTQRVGGGMNIRYDKRFSPNLDAGIQLALQMNDVKSTSVTPSSDLQNYIESTINWGPTINYNLDKKTFAAGLYENFSFKNAFTDLSHFVLPYASAYYNPNTAVSLGTRGSYNVDPSSNYSYLSVLVEFIYRFGSKVPDTLITSLTSKGQIKGVIYIDENNDGKYELNEKIVTGSSVLVNSKDTIIALDGKYECKVNAGDNNVMVVLPNEYKNYQFTGSNPETVELTNGETKEINFGINRRVSVYGKVVVQDSNDLSFEKNEQGFQGAQVEITGADFQTVVETSASGVFNVDVPKPGKYKVKLLVLELPIGYKSIGSTTTEFTAEEGNINKLEPIILSSKRVITGRVFIDKDQNGEFDETDDPVVGVKIGIGKVTTQSEVDGSFSITTVPSGIYAIKISPKTYKGYHLDIFNDKISVPPAGTIQLSIPFVK